MDRPVEVLLIGAGGYGGQYLEALLSRDRPRRCRLVGVVEPFLAKCRRLDELRERKIPVCAELEEFAGRHGCDLAVVVSPIHFHCRHVCQALDHGFHVLTEKPLCASLAQIAQMRAAEQRAGKYISVGFQWSFSPAVQRLKADIVAGRFGKARRLRTLSVLPRDEQYFTRNDWVGRKLSGEGEPIFDSPVNNAAAHYLHNMLYVLGDRPETSASPERVEAELGRANCIENFDTAALRVGVSGGAELLFYASHAVTDEESPEFVYEFETATVHYETSRKHLIATFVDGDTIDYGSPDNDPFQKLWDSIDAVATGRMPVCGITAAAAHAQCVIRAQGAAAGIYEFPDSVVRVDRTRRWPIRYVPGLQAAMRRCYSEGKLFGEAGIPLARIGCQEVTSSLPASSLVNG